MGNRKRDVTAAKRRKKFAEEVIKTLLEDRVMGSDVTAEHHGPASKWGDGGQNHRRSVGNTQTSKNYGPNRSSDSPTKPKPPKKPTPVRAGASNPPTQKSTKKLSKSKRKKKPGKKK